MTVTEIWRVIQRHVGAVPDGDPNGLDTSTKVAAALGLDISQEQEHHVKASSFADPADVKAFRKCKADGGSDQTCFGEGDNGVGCWGDDTTIDPPMCALPPEDMEERWGSVLAARHKMVLVEWNGIIVSCRLSDRMPRRANIHNKAGIDLSPSAVSAFLLTPPIMLNNVTWRWA